MELVEGSNLRTVLSLGTSETLDVNACAGNHKRPPPSDPPSMQAHAGILDTEGM